MFVCAKRTSAESGLEDLFEYVEMASDCEGAGLEVGGLGGSVVSPLGRTPSANHTLLCSRERDPNTEHHITFYYFKLPIAKRLIRVFFVLHKGRTLVASLFQDSHRYHDGRRRRAEYPRGLSLLQRGDGGAVLCRVVGVRTLTASSGRRLPRLGCKKQTCVKKAYKLYKL